MHVLNRLLIMILLLASLGLTACTGTDLSGTAGDVGDDGNPAAAVAGDEGEDDAVGEGGGEGEVGDEVGGEVGDAGEGDVRAEPGEDGAEDDAAGEGEGDEAEEGDVEEGDVEEGDEAEEGDVEEADGDLEGDAEDAGAEDDAVGEAGDEGEGEDDAVAEAGDEELDVLPLAPVANAQAALDALASVRFDTLSWRDLGDRVDREDMASLRTYFDTLSRSDLSLPDCEGCLDTINVLLGGQAAKVDDIAALLSAVVANG